jgi:hypothetical protein
MAERGLGSRGLAGWQLLLAEIPQPSQGGRHHIQMSSLPAIFSRSSRVVLKMKFQEILNQIADGDIPGIQFTRQKLPLWILGTIPYEANFWDCQGYFQEHRN